MRIRIVIDVDDTICTNVRRLPYDRCKPVHEVIDKINFLHDKRGYYIILYTARGMVSCNGIVSEAISKNKATLEKWLELNNVHYDELVFGKPIADLYVDDKALNKDDFIKEEFYPLKGGGSKRKVERIGRFVKKDLGSPEDTERFKDWIEDCGDENAHPGIISYLYSGVYMDYIDGENLCDCMTEEDLHTVIEIIEEFKKKKKDTLDLNKQVQILESNYSGEREFDSIIAKCKKLVLDNKKIYEENASFGHGDMILSNIIKCEGKLFLIDPRYFRDCSSYIFDYGKLRMSLKGYEKRFGITEKDNTRFLALFDDVMKEMGIYRIVLVTCLMYVCRLYKYKDEEGKKKVVDFAKEIMREIEDD